MAEALYKVVLTEGSGEITEKKSRFIGEVFSVKTEDEALAKVAAVKKKYYDARHHCYAYICGDKAQNKHYSDDGEPSGSAGAPIMSVLEGAGVNNICLVVTRYFGGTLLGVGGLVRAYTDAAKEAVAASEFAEVKEGYSCELTVEYTDIGKFKHYFDVHDIKTVKEDYGEKVVFTLSMERFLLDGLVAFTAETTAGRSEVTEINEILI